MCLLPWVNNPAGYPGNHGITGDVHAQRHVLRHGHVHLHIGHGRGATATTTVTVKVDPRKPATGLTLTASLPRPQVVGAAVLFTATGSYSSGDDYRFCLDDGSGPRVVQDYGGGATYALPTTLPVGTYRIIAHVRTNPTVAFDTRAELRTSSGHRRRPA
jgi:hypothetical protein